jgi:LmbE family N-acetylglucosaminyl deacetylase
MDLPGQPALTTPSAPASRDLPTPGRALAIGAHPDDIEFGCAGTLAKWAAAGSHISYLVLTDGSKGTWDVNADQKALIERRQHEQRDAARRVGAKGEVVFLGQVDGELETTLALRGEVAFWIRALQPDVVLGHDPWRRYRLHPDHRHAGFLTVDGIVAARDPFFFRDQEFPHHRPDALLLFEADEPDHVEDVTPFVDAKLAALEAHASQFESTMGELAEFRERIRNRLAEHGAPIDVAAGEAFKRIAPL